MVDGTALAHGGSDETQGAAMHADRKRKGNCQTEKHKKQLKGNRNILL